jgi:hypothetical protein
MREKIFFAYAVLLTCTVSGSRLDKPGFFKPEAANQILFTENKGQVSDQYNSPRADVLFGCTYKDLVFHLRNNGLSYQLRRIDSWKEAETVPGDKMKLPEHCTIYRLDINWINCKTNFTIKKSKPALSRSNFYSASCPNGAVNVRAYEEVTYEHLYNGIDLKWYSKNGELKYDYICAPNSDFRQIQLQIEGAEEIRTNEKGELEIKTPFGTIIEHAPIVKQRGAQLKSSWIIRGNTVGFTIENLESNFLYVIDPIVRAWGTYYGDSGDEIAYTCTKVGDGDIYMAGLSSSTGSVLATAGGHQTSFAGGLYDGFIAKFNSNGMRIWGTYYGGTGLDQINACAADNNMNVFVAGVSDSNNGNSIATVGSHQPANGGNSDAFIAKFDSSGVRLWGTYYGGSGTNDVAYGCTTDQAGNVYVAGRTDCNTGTVIATAGSHQQNYGGGTTDGFLVKFDANGVRQWGTYYGGNAGDWCNACPVDYADNISLIGQTTSTVNISTPGCHQPSYAGGGPLDSFIAKFNNNGVRQWGTYFGGTGTDEAYTGCVDAIGNIYLSGQTSSAGGSVIATPGSFQSTFGGGGNVDAFITKFSSSGVRQWGTYYGDASSDRAKTCFVDLNGSIYMGGFTNSTGTVIASPFAYQSTYNGGLYDAFIVKFDSTGSRQWGTYYGGTGDDRFLSGFARGNSTIYVVGQTTSNSGTVIASLGSYQASNAGSTDAMLIKFYDCTPDAPANNTPPANQNICANNTTTLYASSNAAVNWYATANSTIVIGTGTVFVTQTLSPGTYTFYAEALACVPSSTRTAITVSVGLCTRMGENEMPSSNLNVYPNPTKGELSIESIDSERVEISDITGRIILSEPIFKSKSIIDISSFASGIYFLKATTTQRVNVIKIIKE